jgi:hypothetical protein
LRSDGDPWSVSRDIRGETTMIYEMRTYTLVPGKMPAYLEAAATIGRPARGDNYGQNHGYWTSEFGSLNQIWHLWSWENLVERERLRGELQKNEKWTKEYIPAIRSLLQRQDIRILNPAMDFKPPTSGSHVYEFRAYRTQVGAARPWINLFKEYLPHREKYSPVVGLWWGEFPQPNEVAHMWAYPDLNARMAARGASMKDPKWQEFLGKSGGSLLELSSTLLLPTAYSPIK